MIRAVRACLVTAAAALALSPSGAQGQEAVSSEALDAYAAPARPTADVLAAATPAAVADPAPLPASSPEPAAAAPRPSEPGLASGEVNPRTLSRSPLTLPRARLELLLRTERVWPERRWVETIGLAVGVADRVEIAVPFLVSVSMG